MDIGMVMVNYNGMMGAIIRVNLSKVLFPELEHILGQMVERFKASGRIIKLMGMVHLNGLVECHI